MKKIVPFYSNHLDGIHCTHAVFRSLFDYFLNKKLSWKELEQISKFEKGKATWTFLSEIELAKQGVEVVNIEPFDYERFYNEGEKYLQQAFNPETARYYKEESNLFSVKKHIPKFLKQVHHESRKASISEIDQFLQDGYLVAVELNSAVLNNRKGFDLHFVLITDYSKDSYIIHDPGLPPHEGRVVSKEEFLKAFGGKGSNGEVSAFRLIA